MHRVALLAVLLCCCGDGDASAEPLPPLPAPSEPRERPLVALGQGFGWTWLNPLPRAMPTWHGVARRGDRVALVGQRGAAARYADRALFAWRTGTSETLRSVAWTSDDEALAAGDGGTLLRLGAEVARIEPGTSASLRSVSVDARGPIVVGDGGTVLRVEGERVTRVPVPVQVNLLASFSRGSTTWAAGGSGAIVRIDGAASVELSGTRSTLRAIGGCERGGIYAGGDGGVLVRRGQDGAWTQLRVEGTEPFTAIACDHGRVAATRMDGSILLLSGMRSVSLPSGYDRAWHALSGGAQGPTWMVGTGGRIATIEADHVRTRTSGPTVPIRALGGMGGALIAVGEWGRILRESEQGMRAGRSPTEAGLAALVALDEARLLAIGDYGAIVDIRFDRASLIASPTRASLRAGLAQGERVLLVGSEGTIVRGPLDALESTRLAGIGDLWAVAGSLDDAIAVGEDGVVVEIDARGNRRWSCGERTLRGLVRTSEGTWACGDGGAVARLEGARCVIERSGGPTLHAMGFAPDGRLLAVGEDGVALVRAETGAWIPASLEVGDITLYAIWRSERDVFLGGTGGTIVRHVRLDR